MSDRLFIHWNADGIDGCDAQSGRGKGRVHTCFSFPYPVDDEGHPLEPVSGRNAAAAAEMGSWLRERVKQTGIKSSEVSVLLPRNDCFVRRLELPQVPANELPDLVRMQAASICSTPVEDLAIDFLPLPADEGATAQAVQLVPACCSVCVFVRLCASDTDGQPATQTDRQQDRQTDRQQIKCRQAGGQASRQT